MAIERIYMDYHQKSRSFLNPLIGIHKGSFIQPLQTYISWPDVGINPEDRKLLLQFNKMDSEGYRKYEAINLLSNTLYEAHYHTENDRIVYVFDLSSYKTDFDNFLGGRYSKLTMTIKALLGRYYGRTSGEWAFIESYLYPERFYDIYTNMLWDKKDIEKWNPRRWLEEVGQLCDKPNLQKETLYEKLSKLSLDNSKRLSNLGNLKQNYE